MENLDLSSVDVGDMYAHIDFRVGRTVKIDLAKSKLKGQPPLIQIPLLPLIGYAYRSQGGRFDKLLNRVIGEEGVSMRDFYVKEMPELSIEGGFRSGPMLSGGFNWSIQRGEEGSVVKINTLLYRGSYVTILLREVMKPSDPVASGF